MKLVYLLLIASLVALFVFVYRSGLFDFSRSGYQKAVVAIRDTQIEVDLANTPAKREKGLGGRESLDFDKGMLFLFENPGMRSFWMRDVSFPIDIVWINEDIIVGIDERVQPEPDVPLYKLTRYRSPQPVDTVLELAAGKVDEIGALLGDDVNVRFEE